MLYFKSILGLLFNFLLYLKALFESFFFQESQQVPKLKINLGPKKPVEHAFFAV